MLKRLPAIRPSRRFLGLGLAALVVSVVAILFGEATRPIALIAWALLGLAAFGDLIASRAGNRSVTFAPIPELFVGETHDIKITVAPAPEGLSARIDWPEGLRGPDEIIFDNGTATIPVATVRRGAWEIAAIWLHWTTRLGLFELVPRLPVDLTVNIVPNIRLVQSGAITSQVLSTLYGVKENRAIGEGSEFHQLRDFVRGMDTKSIDWKRSARYRQLVAKELRAERNHHVIIAFDNGYLMREEIAGLPKIDHAVTAGLAAAWAAAIGGDLVGFYAYDARPRLFVSPEPGRAAFAHLRSRTADLSYVTQETNHTLALSELNARTPKRSLIIVFSDFVDTTTAELLVENVSILAKRHVIIFVAIRDPEMDAMVEDAPETMDGVAELVAVGQTLKKRRTVFDRLARLGVMVIDARPGTLTPQLISTYLEIKARELI